MRAVCQTRGIVYQGFSLLTANARELTQGPIVRAAARTVTAIKVTAGITPSTKIPISRSRVTSAFSSVPPPTSNAGPLKLPALAVWRLYRGRANCENRIKELKYDFAAGSLCMREFWATEAALNVVMLAFNLMSLFRQVMLKTTKHHTLATLRYKLFAQAGYITHEGRRRILKLATAMRKREWFTGLWTQSQRFDLPVAFTPTFVHQPGP